MRTLVPAPSESTVVIMKPAAPELAAVLIVIEVTQKPRLEPEAGAVVKIGAPKNTTLSERTSTPVTTPVLVPLRMLVTPANTSLDERADADWATVGEYAK